MRSGGLLQGRDTCQQKIHIGYGWAIMLEKCLKKVKWRWTQFINITVINLLIS